MSNIKSNTIEYRPREAEITSKLAYDNAQKYVKNDQKQFERQLLSAQWNAISDPLDTKIGPCHKN